MVLHQMDLLHILFDFYYKIQKQIFPLSYLIDHIVRFSILYNNSVSLFVLNPVLLKYLLTNSV